MYSVATAKLSNGLLVNQTVSQVGTANVETAVCVCLRTESVKFRKEKNERHHRPFKSRVGCSVRLGP